jgi:cellulose synthase operon protein C
VKIYSQRGVEAFRSYPITYSPNRQEVRVLRARITKPDGSVVESYGDSDRNINEPWSGMYYDARARMLSFPALAAGDLLELQYRIEDTAQDNLLSDYWGDVDYVQGTAPKLRYQYFVEMPSSRPLYWNSERVGAGVPLKTEQLPNGRTLYRWSANDVSKVVPEPSMPGWAEVVSTLHVSTYKTWEQVGQYYWGLVRDQLTPNEDLRRTVEKTLEGVDRKDDLAVVRAIYNFVVTNTRYVALEFGIHGYKPYRVDRVLSRRFGDCKDKASLIHAMLKVAGVDSRLVLLRMRHLGAIGQQPASLAAFNHAIAYVPKYDLFLDGTAEFHGAKELPSSDRLADVLIVEPDKASRFLTTPEAKPEDNLTELEMQVALQPDGSATAVGKSKVSGQSAPEYRRTYQAANTRKATFEQGWATTFPGLTVKDVNLKALESLDQDVQMDFSLGIPRYSEAAPGALRFHPFGSGRSYTQGYAPLTERRFDLVMRSPWVNRFKFRYTLPKGFAVAELPKDVKDETPFGRLLIRCAPENETLLCTGEMALTTARVKAQDYAQFRAFLGRVDQAFSRKISVSDRRQTDAR